MQKTWHKKTGKYSTGETLVVGKVAVAEYHWDSLKPKDGPVLNYRMNILLPGISFKEGFTHRETPEEAKAAIERAVDRWLEWLNHEELPEGQLL